MFRRTQKIAFSLLLATTLAIGVGGYVADQQIFTANASSSAHTQQASFQWGIGRGIGYSTAQQQHLLAVRKAGGTAVDF